MVADLGNPLSLSPWFLCDYSGNAESIPRHIFDNVIGSHTKLHGASTSSKLDFLIKNCNLRYVVRSP